MRSTYATGTNVGAPPDPFNQRGQDWSQPPWNPHKLAEASYKPWRDMLRTVLRHSGGIRVDHILGLFRLWWIPRGAAPTEGTYVHYDHEAMLGVLALEASRAGAVVVGEDLGTVAPGVRETLSELGILGTSVMWFEQDEDAPIPPEDYRRLCMASVTTHDLPPTAGYLAGEHIDLRERLGVLTTDPEEEHRGDRAWVRGWSPEQIARRLPLDFPDDPSMRISAEAIYQALYVENRGGLERRLSWCLRRGRTKRMPRARTRQQAWAHVTEQALIEYSRRWGPPVADSVSWYG